MLERLDVLANERADFAFEKGTCEPFVCAVAA